MKLKIIFRHKKQAVLSNSLFQSVKEPLFSLSENRGFGVFRCKYKQYLREKELLNSNLLAFSDSWQHI